MSRALRAGDVALPANPVFIVGYPRSGTTLLQAFVATFPRFFSFPETHFFNVILPQLGAAESGCCDADSIDGAADAIFDKAGIRLPAALVEDFKERCRGGCVRPREIFEAVVRALLVKHHPEEPFAEPFHWCEKTPNHAYFLDQIAAVYPESVFLNIVRHPVAAVSSRRRAFTANRDTPAADLARLWNRSVETAAAFAGSHPGRLHSLRYEDLAAKPEETMREVAAFLGAPFDAAALKDFARAGDSLRHRWEEWKEGVGADRIFNGNTAHFDAAPLAELLVVQQECRAGMARWGYRPLHRLRQRLYSMTGWLGPGAGREP